MGILTTATTITIYHYRVATTTATSSATATAITATDIVATVAPVIRNTVHDTPCTAWRSSPHVVWLISLPRRAGRSMGR